MVSESKKVTREFRVTVTVEEVEAPKVADIPVEPADWSQEADEFLDESDYTK
jgi:hypothetical protein